MATTRQYAPIQERLAAGRPVILDGAIGTIEAGGCLRVRLGAEETTLLDFATASVTGLGDDLPRPIRTNHPGRRPPRRG